MITNRWQEQTGIEGIVNTKKSCFVWAAAAQSCLWLQPHLQFRRRDNFSMAGTKCPPGTSQLQLCKGISCTRAQVIAVGT